MSDTASPFDELNAALAGRVSKSVGLAQFTTFQIGGPADYFFEARSSADLCASVQAARNLQIPFFLLGKGANILVSDAGFRGLVIRNLASEIRINRDVATIRVESGATVFPDLIDVSVNAGLSGLEHFAGIPSTVGGALWQNLHFLSPAPERERTVFIDEILLEAEILDDCGLTRTVPTSYFKFGYDYSILHDNDDVVLSATFQLKKEKIEVMRSIISANLQWRRERHPPLDTEPSAGSIFKKIEGIGAGRLIDQCGLKGTRIGGIEVSNLHANIFVNRGGGTAENVREMIRLAADTVEKETGYRLETEIRFVGDFSENQSE